MKWLCCVLLRWISVSAVAEAVDSFFSSGSSSPLEYGGKLGLVSALITIEESQGSIYLRNALAALNEYFPYQDFDLEVFVLMSGEMGYQRRHTLTLALSEFPQAVVIRHESLCMAYNEALQSVSGRYILMMSDYVEFNDAHTIKILVSHVNEHKSLVGGKLVYMTNVVRDVGIDYALSHSRALGSIPRPYFRFSGVRNNDVRTSEAIRVLGVSRAFAMIRTEELLALAHHLNRSKVCLFDCEYFRDAPVHLDADLALQLKFKLQRDVWWLPQAAALIHGSDEEMNIGLFDHSAKGSREFETRWGSLLMPFITTKWQLNGVRLVWSTECGVGQVLGFTTEALNFVTALESRLPSVRVETGDTQGCLRDLLLAGFPSYARASMKRMLEMEQPRNHSLVTVLVIHRDAGRFPSFLRYSFGGNDDNLVVVGRSMFETDKIEQNWVVNSNREEIREVWVPSHFNVDTFANSGVHRDKLRVVGECLDIHHYDPLTTAPLSLEELASPSSFSDASSSSSFSRDKHTLSLSSFYSSLSSSSSIQNASLLSDASPHTLLSLASPSTFRVLSIGKWEVRKGWLTLLEAFYEAFTASDDVVLLIRAHLDKGRLAEVDTFRASYLDKRNKKALSGCDDCDNVQVIKEHDLPRVVYLQDIVPFADLPALYKSVDCFVLPSHGEGWGLPLLEAMRMGVPTLATNFSGNMEFMNENNSYLVKIGAMVSHPSLFGHRWAEASVPHMQHLLRCLYQEDHQMKEKEVCNDVLNSKLVAQQAIKDVAQYWSQEALADRIISYVDRLNREAILENAESRRHKTDETDFSDGWQKTVYHEIVEHHHSPGRLTIRVNG